MRWSTLLVLIGAVLVGGITGGAVHADEPVPAALPHKMYLPQITRSGAVAAAEDTPSAAEQEVLELVNAARADAGCAPLRMSAQLTRAARGHSLDMGQRSFFSHTAPAPNASSPWDRIKATGYRYTAAAENIAAGYSTAPSVMDGWLKSSGHRANILNCNLTEIGVGLAVVNGSPYTYYWTQDFGTPQ